MTLSPVLSERIVATAYGYIDTPFDFIEFNCVHFVRAVYSRVGISLPLLVKNDFPPQEFHLSEEEFGMMPIGHSVFFKRKTSSSSRLWTHLALIVSPAELIHCSRHLGSGVTVSPLHCFLETYELTKKPL